MTETIWRIEYFMRTLFPNGANWLGPDRVMETAYQKKYRAEFISEINSILTSYTINNPGNRSYIQSQIQHKFDDWYARGVITKRYVSKVETLIMNKNSPHAYEVPTVLELTMFDESGNVINEIELSR